MMGKDVVEKQVQLRLDDVDILFPMKPYQVQVDYMKKVIESCQDKKQALLESPTGTGKTLCLLTASLAWLKRMRECEAVEEEYLPRIIYCSRTHS
jgi:regulator of telomere elongation helicase 1